MATSVDVEVLTAAIDGDQPTGVDLREQRGPKDPYYAIRDLRTQARDAERKLEYGDVPDRQPGPLWRSAQALILEALATQTKDLELVAYLIESLTRLERFPGLQAGLQVAAELVTQFWDDLYPVADGDPLSRVAFLNGLNGINHAGTLIGPILTCPITESQIDGSSFSTSDYQIAERRSDTKAARDTLEAIRKSAAATPAAFIAEQRAMIRGCNAELDRLTHLIDERLGHDALHTSRIREALDSCLLTITYLTGPEPEPEPAPQAVVEPEVATSESGAGSGVAETRSGRTTMAKAKTSKTATGNRKKATESGTAIVSRDQALDLLAQIASYFREQEPHSPISYALDQVVRWGRMPLPELVSQLIPDPNARLTFFTLAGIDAPEHDDELP